MPRALLAEDEMLVREVAVEDLRDAGFTVVAVCDGEAALAVISSDPDFDLLYTDIRMPGAIDGWELGRRAYGINPQIRIIYATGYSETIQPLADHERLVAKPCGYSDIVARLKDLNFG